MNRDKQIEEMAKTLCEDYGECKKCTLSNPECSNPCMVREDCERLYNQGYRKSTEVAREIFERLHSHRKFDGHTVAVWKNDLICIAKEFGVDLEKYDAELKKKYTESEKDDA